MDLLHEVADYYSEKLAEHGETPNGVDWNGEESQITRFEQLCKLVKSEQHFTINDLGCGYGALYEYLRLRFDSFIYSGVDISESMVLAANNRLSGNTNANFAVSNRPEKIADYSVASGIFNVRMGRPDHEWKAYMGTTIDLLNRASRVGFAFNCLTSYSDADKMHDYLYYANAGDLFNLCKEHYSRNVALLHDYDLYEFTIIVRKQI